jgi:hypothetical protein
MLILVYYVICNINSAYRLTLLKQLCIISVHQLFAHLQLFQFPALSLLHKLWTHTLCEARNNEIILPESRNRYAVHVTSVVAGCLMRWLSDHSGCC